MTTTVQHQRILVATRWLLLAAVSVTFCSCRTLSRQTASSVPQTVHDDALVSVEALERQQRIEHPGPNSVSMSLNDQQPGSQVYSLQHPVVVDSKLVTPRVVNYGLRRPSAAPAAYEQWRGGPATGQQSVAPVSYNAAVSGVSGTPHTAPSCSCCSPPHLSDFYPDLSRRGESEYICNGGDSDTAVKVKSDWSVYGLHVGDAVAHYDTVDGRLEVEATNDNCIYAPRFAAVRKVTGVVLHDQRDGPLRLETDQQLAMEGETQIASTVLQPLQAGRHLKVDGVTSFRDHVRTEGAENMQRPIAVQSRFMPFEDFSIIRRGVFDNTQKARLATQLAAAIAWTGDQAVQVTIEGKAASEASNEVGMQSVYRYEMPAGKPRLRIVKVASKQNARPGDTIEFRIRFDNVGDQPIGNVTIVDSLVTRLEYVEGSQSSSLKANFMNQVNEAESLVLRWEIIDPLDVGDGGVIKFTCRVR